MNQKKVVQSARLRDQVYDLIREQLKAGEIEPGQRLFEVELAGRYGVSRTPVREALFQLAREGLLMGTERGYALPLDRPEDLHDRLQIHLLLDPYIARRAALESTSDETSLLSQAVKRMSQAHRAGSHHPFAQSFYQFRATLIAMCGNVPLIRCAMMIEDQYLPARNEYFKRPEHRQVTLAYLEGLLTNIRDHDAQRAEEQTRLHIENLIKRFKELAPAAAQRAAAKTNTPRLPRKPSAARD